MSAELSVLEAALGHRFRDRELLERALTHKSRAHEHDREPGAASDNEQLEFLGDAILGFVVSDCLLQRNTDAAEGRLSKLKAHLVSASHLYSVAQQLDLGEHLRLGRGEEMSGGRAKKALLADAVEAIIAAMYIDGGMDPARQFIEAHVVGSADGATEGSASGIADYKSALQEVAQSLGLPPPRYAIVAEDGPEHAKTFTVEARLGKDFVSRAEGMSKKAAGQKAAQVILQRIDAANHPAA